MTTPGAEPRLTTSPTSCSRAVGSRASPWPAPSGPSTTSSGRSRASPAPRPGRWWVPCSPRCRPPASRSRRWSSWRRRSTTASSAIAASPAAGSARSGGGRPVRRRARAGRVRGRLPARLDQGRAGRPRRAHLRRPPARRPRRRRPCPSRVLARRHGQRHLPQAAGLPAVGLRRLRPRPRRAERRRRGAGLGVDPVLLRAGHLAARPAARRSSTAGCCRTTRSRCSTGSTSCRRAGRRSASGSTHSASRASRRRTRARVVPWASR